MDIRFLLPKSLQPFAKTVAIILAQAATTGVFAVSENQLAFIGMQLVGIAVVYFQKNGEKDKEKKTPGRHEAVSE